MHFPKWSKVISSRSCLLTTTRYGINLTQQTLVLQLKMVSVLYWEPISHGKGSWKPSEKMFRNWTCNRNRTGLWCDAHHWLFIHTFYQLSNSDRLWSMIITSRIVIRLLLMRFSFTAFLLENWLARTRETWKSELMKLWVLPQKFAKKIVGRKLTNGSIWRSRLLKKRK